MGCVRFGEGRDNDGRVEFFWGVIFRILPCSPKCVWTCKKKYKILQLLRAQTVDTRHTLPHKKWCIDTLSIQTYQLHHFLVWLSWDTTWALAASSCAPVWSLYSRGWCRGSSVFLELKRKMWGEASVLPGNTHTHCKLSASAIHEPHRQGAAFIQGGWRSEVPRHCYA